MTNDRRIWAIMTTWLVLALILLLMPAPREWGEFGKVIRQPYDEWRGILQPLVHIVLMASCTYILTRSLISLSPWKAAVTALMFAVLLAVGMELLQSLLPSSFARHCDPLDLIPSFAGTLVGGAIGAIHRIRSKNSYT